MDQEKKKDDECDCSAKECGCGGASSCGGCGTKVIMALVLLLLGGVIGYLMGSHCSQMGRGMMGCPISTMMQPVGK